MFKELSVSERSNGSANEAIPAVRSRLIMTTNDHSHHSRRSTRFMGGLVVSIMSRGARFSSPINEDIFLITGFHPEARSSASMLASRQLSGARVIGVRCRSESSLRPLSARVHRQNQGRRARHITKQASL